MRGQLDKRIRYSAASPRKPPSSPSASGRVCLCARPEMPTGRLPCRGTRKRGCSGYGNWRALCATAFAGARRTPAAVTWGCGHGGLVRRYGHTILPSLLARDLAETGSGWSRLSKNGEKAVQMQSKTLFVAVVIASLTRRTKQTCSGCFAILVSASLRNWHLRLQMFRQF